MAVLRGYRHPLRRAGPPRIPTVTYSTIHVPYRTRPTWRTRVTAPVHTVLTMLTMLTLAVLTMSIPHQVDLKIEVDPNSAYRANNGAEINGFGRDGFGNFGEINLGGRAAHDFPVATQRTLTHPCPQPLSLALTRIRPSLTVGPSLTLSLTLTRWRTRLLGLGTRPRCSSHSSTTTPAYPAR